MMLYPIILKPVFKAKPWGGRKLQTYFGKALPQGNIGESWELCCREDGMSVVDNGQYRGKTLREMIDIFRGRILGPAVLAKYGTEFPLLFKILDANDRLSVQVHPDDVCAKSKGLINGKDEMWYVIDAGENAKLIYGLKNVTSKAELESAIRENRILQLLNEVAVKPGTFLYIPAGTVHAILGGILVAEIQQNSNTTYRLYDWDRVDSNGKRRELHVKDALDAIHFEKSGPAATSVLSSKRINGAEIRSGPKVKEFTTDEVRINETFEAQTGESFNVIMGLNGNGKILYGGGSIDLNKGDTVLIPSEIKRYSLEGNMLMLLTHSLTQRKERN